MFHGIFRDVPRGAGPGKITRRLRKVPRDDAPVRCRDPCERLRRRMDFPVALLWPSLRKGLRMRGTECHLSLLPVLTLHLLAPALCFL